MGQVAITLKIMPDGVDEDLKKILDAVKKIAEVHRSSEEPVAFGIKNLVVIVITDDKKGTGDIEEKIKKIKGVSEVEITNVTLIS